MTSLPDVIAVVLVVIVPFMSLTDCLKGRQGQDTSDDHAVLLSADWRRQGQDNMDKSHQKFIKSQPGEMDTLDTDSAAEDSLGRGFWDFALEYSMEVAAEQILYDAVDIGLDALAGSVGEREGGGEKIYSHHLPLAGNEGRIVGSYSNRGAPGRRISKRDSGSHPRSARKGDRVRRRDGIQGQGVARARRGGGDEVGISQEALEYSYIEEQPSGTVIANIKWDASLASQYSPDQAAALRFNIRKTYISTPYLPSTPSPYPLFKIDHVTGVISSASVIDRDSLCDDAVSCDVTLDVVVTPVSHYSVLRVVIHVIDVNDNAPVFAVEQFTIEINESCREGALFNLPTATDRDCQRYNVHDYRLLSSDPDKFNLSITRSSSTGHASHEAGHASQEDDHVTARLLLLSPLDRETHPSYEFTLVAIDNGRPPLQASITINIIVIDDNDNAPVFTSDGGLYEVEVSEDILPHTSILRLQAMDKDTGQNSHISYRLSEFTERRYSGVFTVNNMTGELLTVSSLSYDITSVYHLTVVAEDQGSPVLQGYAQVTVRVLDVNNHAPNILVIGVGGGRICGGTSSHEGGDPQAEVGDGEGVQEGVGVCVIENAPEGTIIGHVVTHDPDSGPSGHVTCRLLQSERSYHFNQSESSSHFSDKSQHFSLQSHYSTEEYTLSTAQWDGALGGGAVAGAMVGGGVLGDTARGGVVFDREARDTYYVLIGCSDSGHVPLTTVVTVTVHVLDDNDNSPVIGGEFRVNVTENNDIGAPLLTLTAKDLDIGRHAHLHYYVSRNQSDHSSRSSDQSQLSSYQTTSPAISIDAHTGQVTAAVSFDYELASRHVYNVIVVDCSHDDHDDPVSSGTDDSSWSSCDDVARHRTASTVIIIDVIDVNDMPPVFDRRSYLSSVQENVGPGLSVVRVRAMDEDFTSDFNIVNYAFLVPPSAPRGAGRVVASPPSPSGVGGGGSRGEGTGVGGEEMGGRAGGAGVLSSGMNSGERGVVQDGRIGEPSSAIGGAGKDLAGEAGVRVGVGEVDGRLLLLSPFYIDGVTGEVTTVRSLDREDVPVYTLTIIAYNPRAPPGLGCNGQCTSTIELIVYVLDDNDNSPSLTSTSFSAVQVHHIPCQITPPSSPPPSLLDVTRIEASDPDEGVNGSLSYAVVTSRHVMSYRHIASDAASSDDDEDDDKTPGLFVIDRRTGVFSLMTSSAMSSCPARYSVNVSVSDGGSPPRTIYTTIIVQLNNTLPFTLPSILPLPSPPHIIPSALQTDNNSDNNNNNNNNNTTLVLIAVVVCATVLVVVLLGTAALLVYCCRLRQAKHRKEQLHKAASSLLGLGAEKQLQQQQQELWRMRLELERQQRKMTGEVEQLLSRCKSLPTVEDCWQDEQGSDVGDQIEFYGSTSLAPPGGRLHERGVATSQRVLYRPRGGATRSRAHGHIKSSQSKASAASCFTIDMCDMAGGATPVNHPLRGLVGGPHCHDDDCDVTMGRGYDVTLDLSDRPTIHQLGSTCRREMSHTATALPGIPPDYHHDGDICVGGGLSEDSESDSGCSGSDCFEKKHYCSDVGHMTPAGVNDVTQCAVHNTTNHNRRLHPTTNHLARSTSSSNNHRRAAPRHVTLAPHTTTPTKLILGGGLSMINSSQHQILESTIE